MMSLSYIHLRLHPIFFFLCGAEIIKVEKIAYIWSVFELAVQQTALLIFVFWCHCPVFCDRKTKGSRVYSQPMHWGYIKIGPVWS